MSRGPVSSEGQARVGETEGVRPGREVFGSRATAGGPSQRARCPAGRCQASARWECKASRAGGRMSRLARPAEVELSLDTGAAGRRSPAPGGAPGWKVSGTGVRQGRCQARGRPAESVRLLDRQGRCQAPGARRKVSGTGPGGGVRHRWTGRKVSGTKGGVAVGGGGWSAWGAPEESDMKRRCGAAPVEGPHGWGQRGMRTRMARVRLRWL